MITFKDFLTESRSAPLYHATKIYLLPEIFRRGLRNNTTHNEKTLLMKNPRSSRNDLVYGVSTTRSFLTAKHWGGPQWGPMMEGIVIELDQKKLTHRYDIKPIQYFTKTRVIDTSGYRNEYEEFVIVPHDRPITPSYFTRLYVREHHLGDPEHSLIIDQIRQKYGSQFIRII